MFPQTRAISRLLGILIALMFLTAPIGGALAQEGEEGEEQEQDQGAGDDAAGGRTLHPLTFALTGDAKEPDENVSTALPADRYFTLHAPSGTPGGTIGVACSQAGGGTESILWFSDPILDQRSTVLGNATLTIPVTAQTGGTAPGVQTGDVSGTLTYGWYNPEMPSTVHPHSLNPEGGDLTATAAGTDISNPQTQASLSFPLDWSWSPAATLANSQFYFQLNVECAAGTGITLNLAQAQLDVGYVLGGPNDVDTDGDGIPDSLDPDDDGDEFTDEEEVANGTDPQEAASNPGMDQDGDDYTFYEELQAGTSDTDPEDFPGAGGLPIGLIILVVLAILIVAGGAFAALAVVKKPLRLTISHDGFQAIEAGEKAAYEVTVLATTKKEETVPVILGLKGVPEDWTATLSPDQLELQGGEGAEPAVVSLIVVPPGDAAYEQESTIVVTATPTDEEGKTSAMKPGSSVKAKTIVNIGVTPAEGEGGKSAGGLAGRFKRNKAAETEDDTGTDAEDVDAGTPDDANAEDRPKKRFGGLAGKLKRKKDEDDGEATEAEAEAEAAAAETASEPPAAGAAGGASAAGTGAGKPRLAMGKMKHEPEEFAAGDEVTTTVAVQNKGDGAAEGLRLKLVVNDEEADAQELDLGPGEVQKVTFRWTASDDENRVKVKGEMPRRG